MQCNHWWCVIANQSLIGDRLNVRERSVRSKIAIIWLEGSLQVICINDEDGGGGNRSRRDSIDRSKLPCLQQHRQRQQRPDPSSHCGKCGKEQTNEEQQESTVDGLIPFLDTHSRLLMKGRRLIQLGNCTVVPFRKGEGHRLCGPALDGGCFVGDPTVVHPSKLHPLVAFPMFAATLVRLNHARKSIKGGNNEL